jgi:hypothetical protein
MTPRWIEVTYRIANGRYVFASQDRKLYISNTDPAEAASIFGRLLQELTRKDVFCRVEAFAPLGPALKMLRNKGAICRVGLQNPPTVKASALADAWDRDAARSSARVCFMG